MTRDLLQRLIAVVDSLRHTHQLREDDYLQGRGCYVNTRKGDEHKARRKELEALIAEAKAAMESLT